MSVMTVLEVEKASLRATVKIACQMEALLQKRSLVMEAERSCTRELLRRVLGDFLAKQQDEMNICLGRKEKKRGNQADDC